MSDKFESMSGCFACKWYIITGVKRGFCSKKQTPVRSTRDKCKGFEEKNYKRKYNGKKI